MQHVDATYLSCYVVNSNMNKNGGLLHTLQIHVPITWKAYCGVNALTLSPRSIKLERTCTYTYVMSPVLWTRTWHHASESYRPLANEISSDWIVVPHLEPRQGNL